MHANKCVFLVLSLFISSAAFAAKTSCQRDLIPHRERFSQRHYDDYAGSTYHERRDDDAYEHNYRDDSSSFSSVDGQDERYVPETY